MKSKEGTGRCEQLELHYGGKRIGILHLEDEGIIWRIDDKAVNISGFTGPQLHRFISRLINAPLEHHRRRHQAMPDVFKEMEPNSVEHFLELIRDCGPFSIVPLPMP